jgi:hypothetical protein
VVIDGDLERPTGQPGQQDGESEQFVETAFEGGHLLGKMAAEQVPEGLILGVGVEPLGGVVERLGAGGGPDQNAPEHEGGALAGVAEPEYVLAVGDGLRK